MGLTLPSDLFPQDVVATVTGLSGFAAGLAGAAFTFARVPGGSVLLWTRIPGRRTTPDRCHRQPVPADFCSNHDNSESLRSFAIRSSGCASSEKVRSG